LVLTAWRVTLRTIRPVPAFQAQVLDVSAGGLRDPQAALY
jgi:hypothetical protein